MKKRTEEFVYTYAELLELIAVVNKIPNGCWAGHLIINKGLLNSKCITISFVYETGG